MQKLLPTSSPVVALGRAGLEQMHSEATKIDARSSFVRIRIVVIEEQISSISVAFHIGTTSSCRIQLAKSPLCRSLTHCHVHHKGCDIT